VLNEVYADTRQRMNQTVEAIRRELSHIRTGRASLSILDGVTAEYYGSETPLNQLATLGVPEPQLITVKPFDPATLPIIEKAILKADLGLNPVNDGKLIRVPIPTLTEETRKQYAKRVREIQEEGKTSLRTTRHEMRKFVKELQEAKEITEDDEHRGYDEIQKILDDFSKKIVELADAKEKEVLEI
jgi:ribosome recycling factor